MDLMKFMDELYTTDSNFKIVRNKYYYGHNKNNGIDSDPSRYRYLMMYKNKAIMKLTPPDHYYPVWSVNIAQPVDDIQLIKLVINLLPQTETFLFESETTLR